MKIQKKKPMIGLLLVLCVFLVVCMGWRLLPVTAKADFYRQFPYGGSYFTYERLGALLTPGMKSDEVLEILGKPQLQEDLNGGQRWKFFDDGPTAAWTCIVDFSPTNNSLCLCYFFNVQCYVLTNSLHHEFGSPIDDGNLQDDPFLKMRRDQWYPNK
jgi:hypothetical protein